MVSQASSLPAEMVTSQSRFDHAITQLARAPRIAVDTESDGFHRYPERVCLIQLADKNAVYLIDPLNVPDLSPLKRIFEDARIEKVLHSADYDLRTLDREWGLRMRGLYDTSVAAHFTSLNRLGLGTVLEEILGVHVPKEKKLQRADWSLRPLSEEALSYAASDVTHLLPLRDALDKRLKELGRESWVAEECLRLEETRYVPPEPPEKAFLGLKGSGALDGRGLAILKQLFLLREREALRRGRPPFRVLSNNILLDLAADPDVQGKEKESLAKVLIGPFGNPIRKALRQGQADPIGTRPRPNQHLRPRPTQEEQERFASLRRWRTGEGLRLNIDPALVWPMVSLERLSRPPASLDDELASAEVRQWQTAQFQASIRKELLSKPEPREA